MDPSDVRPHRSDDFTLLITARPFAVIRRDASVGSAVPFEKKGRPKCLVTSGVGALVRSSMLVVVVVDGRRSGGRHLTTVVLGTDELTSLVAVTMDEETGTVFGHRLAEATTVEG